MSPADLRRQWPPTKSFVWAAGLAACLLAILGLSTGILLVAAPAAEATAAPLTVTMDRSLTLLNETPAIRVSGEAIAALRADDTVAIRVAGPAALSQLEKSDPALAEAGSFTVAAGSLPAAARPSPSELHLPIPLSTLPSAPGAYRVTVEIRSGATVVAEGGTWMGRVAARSSPLDLAFVWRAALGVHQGPDGSFFDTVLEQACAPAAAPAAPGAAPATGATPEVSGTLPDLLALPAKFPDWHFSLGVEPVLLTQLRDMADGYQRAGDSGTAVPVSADDPAAKNAALVLAGLTGLAEHDSVEVATSAYAGPDLGLLATQGWRDGFEQIQLGKQELVRSLSLGLPPSGAWSAGLELTTDSLSDYGEASIDHVLVDAAVSAGLNEPVAKDTIAARVHDDQSDRVTLVFADSQLRRLMAFPWDPAVLFAGMAAVLASGDRDALVLTPYPDFVLPPGEYLDAIGEELRKDSWIRTQTMAGLLRAHPPGTRPVLLERDAVLPPGYIGQTIFSATQSAHAAVDDLASVADPASLPLETARRSLYLAESRWWSRPGVGLEEASAGLGYAVHAETVAKGELDKIRLAGTKNALILGHEGQVKLVAENGADYPVTVDLRLGGEGLRFPQGEVVQVLLEPGGNQITVPVAGTAASRELSAGLVAGATVLDQRTTSIRFVTITDVLPWAAPAVLAIILIALSIWYVHKRRAGRAA
jgi:hypothetical protein